MAITRVWLDETKEDCTMCGLCQTTCPEVFEVPDKMHVLAKPDLTKEEEIKEAAKHCPVSVIALEVDGSGKRDNTE